MLLLLKKTSKFLIFAVSSNIQWLKFVHSTLDQIPSSPILETSFPENINDKNDQGLLTIWWCTRRLGKTADEKNEGNYPHEVFKNPRACVQQQGKVPSKSNILIFSVYSKDTNKFSSNSILITVACVFAKLDTLFQPNYPLNQTEQLTRTSSSNYDDTTTSAPRTSYKEYSRKEMLTFCRSKIKLLSVALLRRSSVVSLPVFWGPRHDTTSLLER